MPKRCKHSEEETEYTGEDRISALPDAILQLVLSFLPSEDPLDMCWLSRRWRHLWKSTPALRILCNNRTYWYQNVKELNNFVNYLLIFRDRVPLDVCEISYRDPCDDEEHDEIFRFVGIWIHYALSLCQAQVLKVCIWNVGILLKRDNSALVSQFLRRLELTGVILREHAIDFSGCPKLEHLKLCYSNINGRKISSQSVRHLSITHCDFNLDSDSRIRISAPCLLSLQLNDIRGGVPLLESMPLLVKAFIRLGGGDLDICTHEDYGVVCDKCLAYDDYGGGYDCVLFQGLSGATSLELTATFGDVFIFRKDLKQCPTFSMLKTLLLNEWCVEAGIGALVCFLQRTPVLEKLILQLQLPSYEPERVTYEDCNPTTQLLVLKQLKVVEIICDKEDEVVHQIVKILSTFGVSSDQINVTVIQHSPYSQVSQRFSFEQT